MREINECTAEVFRRSEKRIKERKKSRNRIMALCIPLCLILIVFSVTLLPNMMSVRSENTFGGESLTDGSIHDYLEVLGGTTDSADLGSLDSFSFSLTWGCYGISSYDSASGKLVKTTDATHPEDYVTTYQLTDAQKQMIYDLILPLNVTSYPDNYDPHKNGLASNPPMTLILSVKTDIFGKTIIASNIALTYESDDPMGQRFLSVCKEISDILTATDEWKALPEYEFFYD